MSHSYISRKNFEAWLDLIREDFGGSQIDFSGRWNSSQCKVHNIQLTEEVSASLSVTTLLVKGKGEVYYAKGDDWNSIRVENYYGSAFHFYGKGARGEERRQKAIEILELLTGQPAD